MLLLLRGISGSGKSSLAKLLATALGGIAVAADDFLMVAGEYKWEGSKLGWAHQSCINAASDALSNGKIVIVHNTSTTNKDVNLYKEMAEKYGVKFISLIVEKRHTSGNEHGVTDELLQKQANKLLNSIKLI